MKSAGHSRLLSYFVALFTLVFFVGSSSCGFWDVPIAEPEITVVVNVANLTPDITSLTATSTFNNTQEMGSQQITARLDRFAIALPLTVSGPLVVSVVAHSSENCVVATGQVSVDIAPPPPTRYEVTVNLTPTAAGSGKLCQLNVQVYGKGTVTSNPPGINCVGSSKLGSSLTCSGDFPIGAPITLSETHDARTYGVAWDGLCTTAPCTFTFNASGQVRAGFGVRTCSRDNWCFHNPLPQGNGLNAVWGAAPDDVWAVGDSGTILHYDGMVWSSALNIGDITGANLYGVYGSSANDVWVVGEAGTLIHWDGKIWLPSQQSTIISSQTLRGVWASSPTDVWAVGYSTTILHFDGTNWSAAAPPSGASTSYYGIWGSAADNIYAVGGSAIHHYKAPAGGGNPSWTIDTNPSTLPLYGIHGKDANNIWTVGYRITFNFPFGGITYTPVAEHWNGTAWAVDTNGTLGLRTVLGVYTTPTGKAWAGGQSTAGKAEPSYHDGTAWALGDLKTLTATGNTVLGVYGFSDSDIWAVGSGGMMFHWDGQNWNPARLATGYNTPGMESVWGNSPSDVWAVGATGTLRHFDGTSWTDSTQSGMVTTSSLQQVWGANPNFILAAGTGNPSVVLRYDGTNWAVVPWSGTASTQTLYGMWGQASPPSVSIVGGYGTMATYNGTNLTLSTQSYPIANGTTTTPNQLTTNYIYGAWGTSSYVHAIGDGGIIIQGSGNSWFEETGSKTVTTQGLQAIWGTTASNIWAVGYSGTVMRYNGSAWALDPVTTGGTATTNDSFYGVWASAQTGWIVGSNGVLFRYSNNAWTRQLSCTKTYLAGVWSGTMTDAWSVGSTGTMIRYQP